jgi:hypothetical protein
MPYADPGVRRRSRLRQQAPRDGDQPHGQCGADSKDRSSRGHSQDRLPHVRELHGSAVGRRAGRRAKRGASGEIDSEP